MHESSKPAGEPLCDEQEVHYCRIQTQWELEGASVSMVPHDTQQGRWNGDVFSAIIGEFHVVFSFEPGGTSGCDGDRAHWAGIYTVEQDIGCLVEGEPLGGDDETSPVGEGRWVVKVVFIV